MNSQQPLQEFNHFICCQQIWRQTAATFYAHNHHLLLSRLHTPSQVNTNNASVCAWEKW